MSSIVTISPAIASLLANAQEPSATADRLDQGGVPWLWILLAVGLALGALLAWLAWGRRLPPPPQPWR